MLETRLIPASDKKSRRLMVVLHGLGDSMDGYGWLPSALDLPWLNYLLINAPDDYFGGYSWFDFEGDAATGIERSRKLLFELLDAQGQGGFPADQTVVFGFSQGCLMTIELGIRYPHRFAGLIGISGFVVGLDQLLAEASPVARQQTFLITHGIQDPLLQFDQVRAQVRRLTDSGLNIEWHELAKEHTIAGETELALIRAFVRSCFDK